MLIIFFLGGHVSITGRRSYGWGCGRPGRQPAEEWWAEDEAEVHQVSNGGGGGVLVGGVLRGHTGGGPCWWGAYWWGGGGGELVGACWWGCASLTEVLWTPPPLVERWCGK